MSIEKQQKAGVAGYLALIFAIIFFAGLFKDMEGPIRALDFTVISGAFGTIGEGAANFRGSGGIGARDGFMFALTLFPVVMLALGVVKAVEFLGGLRAAQELLSPILRPLMGIPGISGLALVASLQSTDAGAGMTKQLKDANVITEAEKTIFAAFQFSAGATITNYLSSGAALFDFIKVPIVIPLILMFVLKVFGANLMRLYLRRELAKEAK
ncbi:MAG: nucleoside recognition domain-containing protein [bacterium]